MTVLTAAQSAALQLVGRRPTTLFSTTDRFALELAELANETATAIAKSFEWRALTKRFTLVGDGNTDDWDLPPDYDRMPMKADLYSSASGIPLMRVEDTDQWIEFETIAPVAQPGIWIILGGKLSVKPTLPADESVIFYYLSKWIVSGNQMSFTADADTFALNERLLTLGLIWRWRSMKRMEYAEDLKNYEIAFNEESGKDRGARVIAVGQPRVPFNASYAYPYTLGS